MTTPLSFTSNALTVYKFEPFSYTWTAPGGASSLSTAVSAGIPASTVVTTTSNVVFSSGTGLSIATSLGETIVINALDGSGTVLSTSSNNVAIAPGRFFPPPSNSVYTFFKNEAITDVSFTGPFAMVAPQSTISLPVGLSFVSNTPSNYFLSGTPLLEYPSCNYTILGRDSATSSKIITTVVNIGVRPERVQLDVSGTTLKSNMTVGTAIAPTFITAKYPSQASSNLRYTWGDLPSGLYFSDCNGLSQASGFRPTDGSATLILQGSPNLTAASNFAALGISSNTITLTATRVSLPTISNAQNFTFSFGETILFDTPFIQTFYVGVPVSSSATSNSYRARTYFALTDVSITNITAASLPAGLSLTFNSNDQRAYLSGTPTTTSTSSYTISAVNSNFVTRDLVSPITVANDVITFDPFVSAATDLCVNFILSRPVTTAKPGYYPGSILFRATAASGCNVTFSAPGLAGTGLSLSNIGNNTVQIVGIPEVVQSLSNLSVIASAVGTPATASRDISFSILNDVFTFTASPTTATLIQNVEMTPVQISATTLSERNVISYAATSIPAGLSISTTGKITGTPSVGSPTSGTIAWTATTGYASGSGDVSYNLTPDSVLIVAPQPFYTFNAGDFVSIPIQGSTYSGIGVSNYVTDLSTTFGLTIGSSTGILSGTLISGDPPGPFYPSSPQNFTIDTSAGTSAAQLQATLIASNTPSLRSLVTYQGTFPNAPIQVVYSENNGYSNWSNLVQYPIFGGITAFKSIHSGNYSNLIAFTTNDGSRPLFVSFNGTSFQSFSDIPPSSFNDPILGNIDLVYPVATSMDISDQQLYIGAPSLNTLTYQADYHVLYELTAGGFSPITSFSASSSERIGDRSQGDGNAIFAFGQQNPYFTVGLTLAVKDGVFLVGGMDWGNTLNPSFNLSNVSNVSLLRNDALGTPWTRPTTDVYPVEVACFSLDESSNWLMGGSDTYKTKDWASYPPGPPWPYPPASATIWSSSNQGNTWTSMSNGFGLSTYSITYGSGVWIAHGLDDVCGAAIGAQENLKYFISGVSTQWQQLDLSGSTPTLFNGNGTINTAAPPFRIGPISFDGSNWNILCVATYKPDFFTPLTQVPTLFRHPAGTDISTGWTAIEGTALGVLSNVTAVYMNGLTPTAYYKNDPTGPTTIDLVFSNAGFGTPPVITSPTNTNFTFYEYVPITPIQLSATGVGDIYFFVESTDLPQGLTFDRTTNIISGTPMRVGVFDINILVKDINSVGSLTLRINVLKPSVEKRLDTAGSYTSYLRQYTIVNAAQNAINTHVLPEPTTLGSFMAPQPQDVTLATVDPKCFSTSNCV